VRINMRLETVASGGIMKATEAQEENAMENRNAAELTMADLEKAAGGNFDASDVKQVDLMIKLFKAQGRSMEEVYQIRGLSDADREFIRNRWYKVR